MNNSSITSDISEEACKDIGQYLKRERKARQISLQEVAEATKIARHRLVSIEENRRHEWPAEIFVKGFIKSYAEYIGLDIVDVMNRYHEFKDVTLSHGKVPDISPKKDSRLSVVTSIIALALAAVLWFCREPIMEVAHRATSSSMSKAEALSTPDNSKLLHNQTSATKNTTY